MQCRIVIVYVTEIYTSLTLCKAEAVAGNAEQLSVCHLEIGAVEYRSLIVDAHGVADL